MREQPFAWIVAGCDGMPFIGISFDAEVCGSFLRANNTSNIQIQNTGADASFFAVISARF
jgi:hypothetical protein